ncbi:cell wall-associated NlpC family hydrolase [Nocardiopsis mwathae]|uniref:Cell wall-associated NlpC family hydrolase n=1 Tax=Nocardiopsis mwathae TaxID=1472723 RepID=A0A7W9YI56_9ACTN|nr:C40 family peptidase [Nocardiopsis mwathae]MBB6172544.1 cell wall-associated NlpC family hydrolase [Nocardiopsis mwathae]
MANKDGGRQTARRIATGLGVVVAGGLIAPTGVAYADPEPTREDVEKTLDDLNKEAGKIVQDYNEANDDYKAAKKKADELEEQVGDEEDRYNELRDEVANFASAVYKSNDLDATTTILAAENPEKLLEQSDDLDYLSDAQQSKLDEFGDSSERLFKLKDEAGDALKDAKKAREEAKKKKDEVEAKIKEQKDLLAEFPDAEEAGSQGGSDAAGGYTGSATGNARAALDFAYSQLGKPYIFGSAGPNGYDCSGLVMRSWAAGGVNLPRTTYSQAEVGQRVSRDQLQPGDILFFSSLGHNGLYAGNGKMVHAPRTGKNLEEVPLAGYWDGQFMFGVRP